MKRREIKIAAKDSVGETPLHTVAQIINSQLPPTLFGERQASENSFQVATGFTSQAGNNMGNLLETFGTRLLEKYKPKTVEEALTKIKNSEGKSFIDLIGNKGQAREIFKDLKASSKSKEFRQFCDIAGNLCKEAEKKIKKATTTNIVKDPEGEILQRKAKGKTK
jgi:hypothetical protein